MYDNEEAAKLTQVHKENLNHISKRLSSMANIVDIQPYDPKIATHLRMAADLAEEQVMLDKFYNYPNKESDYKFLEQDDTLEEHHDIPQTIPEPTPIVEPTPPISKLLDDDIHKWLDEISEE